MTIVERIFVILTQIHTEVLVVHHLAQITHRLHHLLIQVVVQALVLVARVTKNILNYRT